ncbi:Gfo/Idh/MocA family protein [Microbacterium phyllosphaerae]|uniref:Gfo/Idh/MocA family protein n=1 Tax=Microbacterium phyllosphaerae TaxID=124798 RepID=UPI0021694921|nr:Gfo/Idh/MocA family oxidoreductase [Microbacterium phyllosphaerae]
MTLPSPRITSPTAVPPLRWGIIGAGWIASRFAGALHAHTPQRVVAVSARNPQRLAKFSTEHAIGSTYADPSALIADPQVDIVYVATPHSSHHRYALEVIAAGKHVLIEKPIATTAADAQEIVDAARAAGVFAMEAMWTRYLPQTDILRQLIEEGALGRIQQVTADFGGVVEYAPDGRMWNPQLAGGALLDMGVYPISFTSMVLGAPERVTATGITGPDGVDLRATALLEFGGNTDAVVTTSLISPLPVRASVSGSAGRAEIHSPFFAPSGITYFPAEDGKEVEEWTDTTFADLHEGLFYQAVAVAEYIGEGRHESPLHTLDETVSIIATIDRIREQLRFVEVADYV